MKSLDSLVLKGISCIYKGICCLKNMLIRNNYDKEENDLNYDGVGDKTIQFSYDVLEDFRHNVGCFRVETGGMLASTKSENVIDKCYFDVHSNNTSGSFYYDVDTMSEVFRKWKSKGYITNGIYHSHPEGSIRPSYHDISSALLHIDFFGLDYFYMPIIQANKKGLYSLFFYVVKKVNESLEVNLNYVIKAKTEGFKYIPFEAWNKSYPIADLKAYREAIDNPKVTETHKCEPEQQASASTEAYFGKVSDLYPDKVLEKVIVCIGTGGARSFLENLARCGFRNFILIDADEVSPSNIATQAVYISEMGKKKTDVIRDKILDINPKANICCVNKYLDNDMSDEEFKGYLDRFPGKNASDYLILGCTDSFEAQKRSALLALKYGNPYMAAMLYKHGLAAEIVFIYPGVTESCPRCLLRDRFEKYENGFVNDVDSSGCSIFATERMNATKGFIATMMLMYREDDNNPVCSMLDYVKDRNFVEIRMNPFLNSSELGIGLFDRVLENASRYTFFDETLWIPQHPDRPEYGSEPCRLCGGIGDLLELKNLWKESDTRSGCLDVVVAADIKVVEDSVNDTDPFNQSA